MISAGGGGGSNDGGIWLTEVVVVVCSDFELDWFEEVPVGSGGWSTTIAAEYEAPEILRRCVDFGDIILDC